MNGSRVIHIFLELTTGGHRQDPARVKSHTAVLGISSSRLSKMSYATQVSVIAPSLFRGYIVILIDQEC